MSRVTSEHDMSRVTNANQLLQGIAAKVSSGNCTKLATQVMSGNYGVATISRLLKITGLFGRISSLL